MLNNGALLLSHPAISGCSGSNAFSPMAMTLMLNGSASAYLPYTRESGASIRIFSIRFASNKATRIFPENSHLCSQQLRPVVEHCGHLGMLRTESLLRNLFGPRVQRLCLGVFVLSMREECDINVIKTNMADQQMLNNHALLFSFEATDR